MRLTRTSRGGPGPCQPLLPPVKRFKLSKRSTVPAPGVKDNATACRLTPVKIAIGSDHAGFQLKSLLARHLTDRGHEILDFGTDSEESVDYPLFCAPVARAVVKGDAERGIVLGGSGQGEQISANKVHGARAALCNELFTARLCREHNDANVLSMGARIVAPALALEIVEVFLTTPFEGGRHVKRLEQISAIEQEECAGS
jgi:ribose 5-phosphate isomerase B